MSTRTSRLRDTLRGLLKSEDEGQLARALKVRRKDLHAFLRREECKPSFVTRLERGLEEREDEGDHG